MGANDPRGVANLDPRGMIGRIYVGCHQTWLHTKYMGFQIRRCFHVLLIVSLWQPYCRARLIWTPGAWLVRIIKEITKLC